MSESHESESTSEIEEISEINDNDNYSDIENPDDQSSRLPQDEEVARFTPGQILRFVRVRFPGNARSFPFILGKRRVAYGQKVVALSDRGMAVGYVNSFPYEMAYTEQLEPIRSISKIAAEEDIQKEKEIYRRQKEAESYCNDKIHYYRLDMVLTHLEFTQWGKKAVFYFIAPQRVDFRDLVKDLVVQLKMRVELRQISVRDRTAALGGLGPCGRELCCSSFLTRYGNIGIKMAKNQNLTMNPTKLNGVCGQLKCCIKYEEDVYSHKRSVLPEEGEVCVLENGDRVRVQRLHILIEQFEAITDQGKVRRYSINQFNHDLRLPEGYKFPDQFENVTIENDVVIGLEKYEDEMAKKFESEINLDFKEYDNLAFNYYRGLEQDHVLSEKEEEEKYDQRQVWGKEQTTLFPEKKPALNSEDDELDEEDELDNEEEASELTDERDFPASNHRQETRPPVGRGPNKSPPHEGQRNQGSQRQDSGPRRDNRDNRDNRDANRNHRDNRRPQQNQRGPGPSRNNEGRPQQQNNDRNKNGARSDGRPAQKK